MVIDYKQLSVVRCSLVEKVEERRRTPFSDAANVIVGVTSE